MRLVQLIVEVVRIARFMIGSQPIGDDVRAPGLARSALAALDDEPTFSPQLMFAGAPMGVRFGLGCAADKTQDAMRVGEAPLLMMKLVIVAFLTAGDAPFAEPQSRRPAPVRQLSSYESVGAMRAPSGACAVKAASSVCRDWSVRRRIRLETRSPAVAELARVFGGRLAGRVKTAACRKCVAAPRA
jgi:hypothetical protein